MQFTDLCLCLAPRLSPNSSEFFRGHAPRSCLCESHSKIAAGCSMLKYLFRGLLNVRYLKVATMCSPFYPFPDRFTKDRRHRRAQQTGLDRAQENSRGSLRALSALRALAWHAACVHSIIVTYMRALACAKLSLACT